MKKIYTAQNGIIVNHLKNLLESEGISCVVKNDILFGAAGELPPTECWPELWLTNSKDEPQAEQLIQQTLQASKTKLPLWQCTQCGEKIEGQFSECWKCGTAKP